ncbi:MAG: FdhF/YdeP family oxidoreductase, partial [Flavobacteriales bacterium]|nr:FdhF/YdeP family oxidoreductase [Flavobacteriales bacterium]
MADSHHPHAHNPLREEPIKVGDPHTDSAGLGALTSVGKQVVKYMRPGEAVKLMAQLNQKGGFDCPGCAWPDPDDDRATLSEYCENGIKAIAEEAQRQRIGAEFFARHSIDELATWTDFEIGKAGRLAEPMYRAEGDDHYRPIAWEDAFNKLGKHLQSLDDPDEAVFYTSGRTTNEAAFLYQLFVREFGTSNLPDCSNMCHEASGKALSETLGIGKGSVTLDDLHKAELIFVIGQNPGTNHPRMLSALEKCKENGGKIISVNPLAEAGLIRFTDPKKPWKMITGGSPLTDIHLPVMINQDVALFKAIMLELLEREESKGDVFDHDFIRVNTHGYEAFIQDLKTYNKADCARASGISLETISTVVDLIESRDRIIICWAMGLTQHENAVDNIRELVNLLLLKGSMAKEGAGTCPVRGHSNVQGDRTVGIWEAAPQAFLDKIEAKYGFKPNPNHGYAVVDAIQAMHENKVKVFVGMGGNFLSAAPDTDYTAQGFNNCELTVHVSTKLNRSHLVTGKEALIFPCLGRTEKDIKATGLQKQSVENSMGVVHTTQGVLEPCSEQLLSEVEVICRMAHATLGDRSQVQWMDYVSDYSLIRDDIAEVVDGFTDYNRKLLEPSGFYLPNGARIGQFKTESGKAQFSLNKLPEWTLAEDELMMMTIRSHDQFNTTIYGLDDRYRGVYNGRRVIFMHPKDMEARGLTEKDIVDITSTYDGQLRKTEHFKVIPYEIPRSCCATYYPETNVLVPI